MGDWTGVKNIFKTESDYKSTCGAKNKIQNLLLLLAIHLGPLLALLAERVANLGDEDLDHLDRDDHATVLGV